MLQQEGTNMSLWLAMALLFVQNPDPKQEEIEKLKKRLDELEKKVQDQPADPGTGVRSNLLNPSITVFGDILWRLDNKDVVEEEDGELISKDDKFLLRETEVDFRASIDPYADGVLIIALEQEIPGEYEVEVEEGYLVIKSLPFGFWEEPPLGIKIKMGRFLTSIGRQNRLHTHDLPQPQRGLTYENFIGEHGYIANGASIEAFLPSFGDSALTLTVELLQGGGWVLGEEGTDRPAFLANLSWFNTFGDEHHVDLAFIAHYGSNDEEGRRQTQFYSVDFLYKWRPLREGDTNSIVFAGQIFYGMQEFGSVEDPDNPPELLPSGTNRAFGWFAYAQYQFDRRWYVGLRYDWTESLEDREIESWRINPYVTCYISEFFRARLAYEYTNSDDDEEDKLHTLLLQVTFVFGSHPPHPYWVTN
jgi:hypothetical protein